MRRKRCMGAAFGFLLVAVFWVFAWPGAWAQTANEATAVADQFLKAVSQGDSGRAFELCSSGLRRGKTAEDFLKSPEIAPIFSGMKSWETVRTLEKGSTVTVILRLTRDEANERTKAIGLDCQKRSGNYVVRDFSLTPWVSSEARFGRYLSDLYARLGELDLAEQEIQKAYSLDPKDPKVSAFLGYINLEKKVQLEKAQQLIQAAHEQDPGDPEFMGFLGWANHLAGKRQESVEWFDKAREAFQKIEGYQASPEYIRFSSHVDKAKAKGWTPTQT